MQDWSWWSLGIISRWVRDSYQIWCTWSGRTWYNISL